MSDALRIKQTFPGFSREDWRAVAEKALKGQPLSRISTMTVDGTEIDPIYERAEGKAPLSMRASQQAWAVAQRVDHPDAAKANEQALVDLSNGTNMLVIPFAGCASARGFGLTADKESLAKALDEVMLDLIKIRLEGGVTGRVSATAFADMIADRGFEAGKLNVSFGLDPIGTFASTGIMAPDWAGRAEAMIETIRDLKARGFEGPFITVDGRPYHDAGATDAQELGAVLATIVAYWRALEEAGFEADEALSMIDVTLSVEANQFGSLAKIRAMRHLWARLLEASEVGFTPLSIHAETSWAMMTRLDPWVNILRATTASFAAGVGGADSVSILPHTAALGLADGAARRISRNLQILLLEESNLYRVTDPASGSGFVEDLTMESGLTAWTLFQSIEAAGGMVAALSEGMIQRAIASSNNTRDKLIATRKAALTGASAFPDIAEAEVAVLDVAPVAVPEQAKDGIRCEALKPMRLAQPYEALRDAAKTADEPSVFFANLGRIADYTARSTWAKNFFEAGGVKALSDAGYTDAAEAAKAFTTSGAKIACVVGPDGLYEEHGEAMAKALKEAGAKLVYIAGRPKALMDALNAAGVDAYAFESCDVLAELTKIHETLGIAPVATA